MRATTSFLGLFCCACAAEILVVEPEAANLSVSGYVLIDLDPAYGVVVLFDESDKVVGSTSITNGRYGINHPVDPGTLVCDGYAVRAYVEDDVGARQETIQLTEDSGVCTMPVDTSIEHWIRFDLPRR